MHPGCSIRRFCGRYATGDWRVRPSPSDSRRYDRPTVGAEPLPDDFLRVFEIARSEVVPELLEVDLPASWARPHDRVAVAFRDCGGKMGWHASLVAPAAEALLTFPWHDHADVMLREDPAPQLPIDLTSGSWSDLEEGWWASVLAVGDDVYVAESDFGALCAVAGRPDCQLIAAGDVSVSGVSVSWNRVPRTSYDDAWNSARIACLNRTPAPRLPDLPN
jgi:hypothetical protein